MRRFIPLYTGSIIIILSCIVSWKWGAGISPDSCGYMSAANSFALNGTFLQYNNTVMTNWPVLYAILLSAGSFFHMNIMQWALLLNCIASLITLFVSGRSYRHNPKVLYFTAAVLTSIPLLKLQVYMLSETIFIMLMVIMLLFIKKYSYLRLPKHLLYAAFTGSLLCLQRYIGIYLIAATAAVLLYQYRSWKHIIPYLFISLLPLCINMYINLKVPQDFEAMERSGFSKRVFFLTQNAISYFHGHAVITSLLLIILPLLLIYFTIKYRKHYEGLVAFSALAYEIASISSDMVSFEEFARYLIILLPMILTVEKPLLLPWFEKITIPVYLISLCASAALMFFILRKGTGGYNKINWQNPELQSYLENSNSKILSNAPDYIYYLSRKTAGHLSVKIDKLSKQLDEPAIFIWVDGVRDDYMNHVLKQLNEPAFNKTRYDRFTVFSKK